MTGRLVFSKIKATRPMKPGIQNKKRGLSFCEDSTKTDSETKQRLTKNSELSEHGLYHDKDPTVAGGVNEEILALFEGHGRPDEKAQRNEGASGIEPPVTSFFVL